MHRCRLSDGWLVNDGRPELNLVIGRHRRGRGSVTVPTRSVEDSLGSLSSASIRASSVKQAVRQSG
jgi:hypothetical protein